MTELALPRTRRRRIKPPPPWQLIAMAMVALCVLALAYCIPRLPSPVYFLYSICGVAWLVIWWPRAITSRRLADLRWPVEFVAFVVGGSTYVAAVVVTIAS